MLYYDILKGEIYFIRNKFNLVHGDRITGDALTLHHLHSMGACVSYVWQSLSDITEQLLVGHQSGSQ